MNPKIIAGIVVLTLGVIVLVVLTTLGGVAKKTIHNTVNSRLEYELPDGYKKNPNFEHCYHNEIATFDEEYYMWNLTNLADVLAGGSPNYNLTGPFSYTEWYCEYDHKVDKKAGILSYRRYSQGYHYVPRSEDDSAMITNINPAYMGLMQRFGGDDMIFPYFVAPTALSGLMSKLAEIPSQTVRIGAVPLVLSGMNQQIIATGVGRTLTAYLGAATVTNFFTNGFTFGPSGSFAGWTSYVGNVALEDTTLTTQTQQILFNAWFNSSNPTGIMQFLAGASANITVATQIGLTPAQATATLQYLNAITTPVAAGVRPVVYDNWANKTTAAGTQYPSGWELPMVTGIVNVAALFDATKSCNLVNSSEYKIWTDALSHAGNLSYVFNIVQNCHDLSLNATQVGQIMFWLGNVFTAESSEPTSENQILLSTWGITTWSDFPYAQWGKLVAGPLKEGAGLAFNPEVAAIPGCNQFSVFESKLLLSSQGLINATNLVTFVAAIAAGRGADLIAAYPFLTLTKINCLAGYMSQVIVPNLVEPTLRATIFDNKQSGLFVTRSVRDWIFNAVDPFLFALGQDANVGLKKNITQTKENAIETYVRIYTGENELHWSLMPYNAGTNLTFWRQNVTVTGYNGSQFLTHGYLDDMDEQKKYPLELYHKDITRPIPFVNKGKEKWNGVHVRYLTLTDSALQSDVNNPANFPYFAQFGGVVNKTSSVGLPIFLSTPNLQSADPSFYPDITLTDLLYGDYDPKESMSHHRRAMFLLVEPTLGSSVWGNLPIQINMQYKPTSRYQALKPTVAPIYWNAIGDLATKQDLDDIKTDLYGNIRAWKILIGLGVGVGVALIITGIVLVAHFRKHENELKESSG